MQVRTTTISSKNGHKITVVEDDYIGKKIAKQGIYEGCSLTFVESLLRKIRDPIVLDVGANIGNHALDFARYAAHVYALEPVPFTFDLLSQNVSQNNLANVHCINKALSNKRGYETIYLTSRKNFGASSFDLRSKTAVPIRVSLETGDELVNQLGLRKVDFIKIDVEGHELSVLQGLTGTITNHRPLVMMEWKDPLSIKRINDADIFRILFEEHRVHVLGSNRDKAYWRGKPLANTRRRMTRLFLPKKPRLYTFDPAQEYSNILLMPNEKEDLLA